jgi:hypothetical protein
MVDFNPGGQLLAGFLVVDDDLAGKQFGHAG